MIILDKKTGWGQYTENIHYVTHWQKEMEQKSTMRFYGGEVGFVVDISRGTVAKDIRVTVYPHCVKEIGEIVSKFEMEIYLLYESLVRKHPGKMSFTISVEKIPHLITKSDFSMYYPDGIARDELFIFHNLPDPDGFCTYYLLEAQQRKHNPELGRVIAGISAKIADCADAATDFGKRFTYVLVNSAFLARFEPDAPSGISGVKFATRGSAELPGLISTTSLKKFAANVDMSNLKIKNGIAVVEGELKAEVVEEEDEIEDNFDEILSGRITPAHVDDEFPPAVSEGFDTKGIALKMQQEILDKGCIRLGDAYTIGLAETLALVPVPDQMIDVIPDLPDVAKKMCIFEGFYYLIPLREDFDAEETFGEPMEMFRLCTDETYPKKLLAGPSQNSNHTSERK